MTHRPRRPSRRPRAGLASIALACALLGAIGLGTLAPQRAWAQSPEAPSASSNQGAPATSAQSQREAEAEAALRAVKASQIAGPTDIALRDQATLKLPAGYLWVPEPAAS